MDSPVVILWLKDLQTECEPECLHSLQNKWILPSLEEDENLEEDHEVDTERTNTATTSQCLPSSCKVSSSHFSSVPSPSTSSYVQRIRRHANRHYSQQRLLSAMSTTIYAVSTSLMSIRGAEFTANVISAEFSKIYKYLKLGDFTEVPALVISLVEHIKDFLRDMETPSEIRHFMDGGHVGGNESAALLDPTVFGIRSLKKLEGLLEDACVALGMADKGIKEEGRGGMSTRRSNIEKSVSSSSEIFESENYQQSMVDVVEGIVTVGNLFSEVVDLRLTRDLGSILDIVGGGGILGRMALKSLVTVLSDGGNYICRLAADIGTVRVLFGVMLTTTDNQDKILTLRCLTTVLCVGEAVKDFDRACGFEIIADLLYKPCFPLFLKLEAVAVLVQATDPWIDLETTFMTLDLHLEKLIVSLTSLLLLEELQTEESFLLIVAAISNLTFLEAASVQHLKRCRTVSPIISAISSHKFSIFVLDHVATILANMAGVESCRQEIIHSQGIDCLLQFLHHRPYPSHIYSHDLSAIAACEHLQQKSAIALSRLANEKGVAVSVFQMGGVHRLINLCRNEKERNYSDGVLIAALASLRKLVSMCPPKNQIQTITKGAEDLLQPQLLESFLLYSSRQESYV